MKNRASQPRLTINNLSVMIDKIELVSNLSFDVFAGEVLGVIGPNGAGKSTLLAALAGIQKFSQGNIELDGDPIHTLSSFQRAQTISWIEQTGQVHWPLSVERLVMLGRIPHLPAWGKPTAQDKRAVETALHDADCQTLRTRKIATLSGGERARVLLARALAAEPSLLFADEPVSALDLSHQLQTMQLLKNFSTNGNSTVVVMHDLSLAARYCDRLLLLHNGELKACGQAADVLTEQNIEAVYGVSVATGCDEVPWVIPKNIL